MAAEIDFHRTPPTYRVDDFLSVHFLNIELGSVVFKIIIFTLETTNDVGATFYVTSVY